MTDGMARTPGTADQADYPGAGREGYELEFKTAPQPRHRQGETTEQMYLREIRNAVVFIAVIVGLVVAGWVVALLVAAAR